MASGTGDMSGSICFLSKSFGAICCALYGDLSSGRLRLVSCWGGIQRWPKVEHGRGRVARHWLANDDL